MMGGGQWMVVLIVAIVMIYKMVKMAMRHEERRHGVAPDPDEGRLREEVRALKERLAVLERIATDGNTTLERQIEALRDERPAPRRPIEDDNRRDRADTREG
jgi:uncharacterized membrane protein